MKTNTKKIFEKIYGDESDTIFRFCLVRVSNREQALDITQDTFMRLWQTLSGGEQIRNIRAFLFTLSQRLIIDWYRKKKSLSLDRTVYGEKEAEISLVDEKTSADNFKVIEAGVEGRYLVDKIHNLDATYQNPVYLRLVEEMSPREIGGILGISANAASVRVNRGLTELRRQAGVAA